MIVFLISFHGGASGACVPQQTNKWQENEKNTACWCLWWRWIRGGARGFKWEGIYRSLGLELASSNSKFHSSTVGVRSHPHPSKYPSEWTLKPQEYQNHARSLEALLRPSSTLSHTKWITFSICILSEVECLRLHRGPGLPACPTPQFRICLKQKQKSPLATDGCWKSCCYDEP